MLNAIRSSLSPVARPKARDPSLHRGQKRISCVRDLGPVEAAFEFATPVEQGLFRGGHGNSKRGCRVCQQGPFAGIGHTSFSIWDSPHVRPWILKLRPPKHTNQRPPVRLPRDTPWRNTRAHPDPSRVCATLQGSPRIMIPCLRIRSKSLRSIRTVAFSDGILDLSRLWV